MTKLGLIHTYWQGFFVILWGLVWLVLCFGGRCCFLKKSFLEDSQLFLSSFPLKSIQVKTFSITQNEVLRPLFGSSIILCLAFEPWENDVLPLPCTIQLILWSSSARSFTEVRAGTTKSEFWIWLHCAHSQCLEDE